MSKINTHNCNLNIWYYLPDEVWGKVSTVYEGMPGWIGFRNGIPYWFGYEDDAIYIEASVESSGLSFYAQMNNNDWNTWIERFKAEASKVLGFDVGEPEDGYM